MDLSFSSGLSPSAEAVILTTPILTAPILTPTLPPGQALELPGRGVTFVRELAGPTPDAPTVLLLHGWTTTADLNFFTCYHELARTYRVIALDHRGHGRGLRTRRAFRLEDCADDAVAVLDARGIDRALVLGYSMGGPVALLTWRRHPERVQGLVLCATAPYFSRSRSERLNFLGLSSLAGLSRATPVKARSWLTDQFFLQRKAGTWEPWALEQVNRHDWRMILEAGGRIGSFSAREWLGEIDVPTSVLITMRDRVVPVRRQIRLFQGITGAQAFPIDGDHDAIVAKADTFVPALERACLGVLERS
ncbi:MAG: alpha/beta fold hydrolase [Acidimicrobiia bacterium]